MASEGKFYLAGPMSGIPQFNFPAFEAAAAWLREDGWGIVSPVEIDEQHGLAGVARVSQNGDQTKLPQTIGTILARDVKVVLDDVAGIVFLNDWHKSKGARLEAFTALTGGKTEFYRFYDGKGTDGLQYAPGVRYFTVGEVSDYLMNWLEEIS